MKTPNDYLKNALRDLAVWFFRRAGSRLMDCRTGKVLGRGLVIGFKGRVYLLGSDAAVLPLPLPQGRVTYWKQEVGFTAHPEPDFPRSRPAGANASGTETTAWLKSWKA